jgi:hypothetical protein
MGSRSHHRGWAKNSWYWVIIDTQAKLQTFEKEGQMDVHTAQDLKLLIISGRQPWPVINSYRDIVRSISKDSPRHLRQKRNPKACPLPRYPIYRQN